MFTTHSRKQESTYVCITHLRLIRRSLAYGLGLGVSVEAVLTELNPMKVGIHRSCRGDKAEHTKYSSGYRVFATKAASPQGVVALVYLQSKYVGKIVVDA